MSAKIIIMFVILGLLLVLAILLAVRFNIVKPANEGNETTVVDQPISEEEVSRQHGFAYAFLGSVLIIILALVLNKAFSTKPLFMEGFIDDQNVDDIKKNVIFHFADEYGIILDDNGNTDEVEFLDTEIDKKGQDENFILWNLYVKSGSQVGYHFVKIKMNQPLEFIRAGKFTKRFSSTLRTYKPVRGVRDWRETDMVSKRLQQLSGMTPEQFQPQSQQELIREIIHEQREKEGEKYQPKPFKSTKDKPEV
jgi:hypothetical protein